MSKWTDWMPWADHTVIANERYKIRFENGNVAKTAGMKIIDIGYEDFNVITHYKRLKANVEAEEAARIRNNAGIGSGMPKKYVDIDWSGKSFSDENVETQTPTETPVEACLRVIETLYELVPPEEVAIELDKLKAELRHRLGAAENKASEPEQSAPVITPIITGPGEYKTADGRKATVQLLRLSPCVYPAVGLLSGMTETWAADGVWAEGRPGHSFDIIGPWTEDTRADEPEMWVNVYQTSTGSRSPGQIHDDFTEAKANGKSHTALGTFKLVKGG